MESYFIKSMNGAVKQWYIPLIVGVLFVIASIVAFASPQTSLLALSIFFALSFFFGGLSEIVFSLVNRHQLENWGWSLAFGIITLVVGVALTIHPSLSLRVLAYYIGFVTLFRSVAAISFAFDIRRYGGKNWVGLIALGLIGGLIAFILIWNPVLAGMSIVILITISFFVTGLFSIYLSLQLRQIHKSSKPMSQTLRARYDKLMAEIRDEWED